MIVVTFIGNFYGHSFLFITVRLGFLYLRRSGSANAHFPECFRPWTFPLNFGLNMFLYIKFRLSDRIVSRGVPSFQTYCPCGILCRGLPTCLLYVSPLLEIKLEMIVGL